MRVACGIVCLSLAWSLASWAAARAPEGVVVPPAADSGPMAMPVPPEAAAPLPAVTGESGMTLERAVELALGNSPVIVQARAKIDQAQGLAIQAGLYPNPHRIAVTPTSSPATTACIASVSSRKSFARARLG